MDRTETRNIKTEPGGVMGEENPKVVYGMYIKEIRNTHKNNKEIEKKV